MQVEVLIETDETRAILNFLKLQKFLANLPESESIRKIKVTIWKKGSRLDKVCQTIFGLLLAKRLLLCEKISVVNHSEAVCSFDIYLSRVGDFLPNLKTLKITRIEMENIDCVLGQLTNVKIRGCCQVPDILFKLNKNIEKLSLEHFHFEEKLAQHRDIFESTNYGAQNVSGKTESTVSDAQGHKVAIRPVQSGTTLKNLFFEFPELRKLSLNKCRLAGVPKFVRNSKKLIFLSLRANYITRVERNELPEYIVYLFLQSNKIEFIDHIPVHLKFIDFSNNQLTKFPDTILFCSKLKGIMASDNKILSCLPQRRFLAMRKQRFTYEDYITEFRKDYQNSFAVKEDTVDTRICSRPLRILYDDKQNIHSRSIQNSFFNSTMSLFWTVGWCPKFITCGDKNIDAIIYQNCLDKTVHSVLLIEYRDLFIVVWTRILNEKDPALRENMINRLKQEIMEGRGLCFTGKLTRLVNSLVGFYPDIRIQISTPEQIYAKIQHHLQQHEGKVNRELLTRELLEIEVPLSKIKEWLDSFE